MSEFLVIPVLGLGAEDRQPYTVTWKGSDEVLYRGLLGNIEEELALVQARKDEQQRQQELRDNGVAVLDDWRNGNAIKQDKPL